jgi:hypothetical protein
VGAIEGQTALAWLLDLPIEDVDVSRTPPARGVYLGRTADGWSIGWAGCSAVLGPPKMAAP